MLAYRIVLLVAAALLASTKAALSISSDTGRLLNTGEITKGGDAGGEERKLPSLLEKINLFNASPAYKKAYSAFERLGLKTENSVFGTTAFKSWANKVSVLDPENAGSIMLKILLKRYDEFKIARYIEASKFSSKSESIAKDLREALFTKWEKAGIQPSLVKSKLASRQHPHLGGNSDEKIVAAYTAFFKAQQAS
ncbi:secreted RxLR effector peptide protein, putative [Phytophthora infestans T30-4]|uniref:Secreted RxLR effector peptide protein, putative n=1 Tax=Phytophthora infestans (strain T30-4) TaxID=403677 RepID=D0NK85_PHYIT|nr:secreted RxLR effector peptide protein, putative [Phytophthora infestans T30-4]EEY59922.1 secreted RxLR effector peptide protein, putative [Phytophthora infestans T30-4]|eukprot:XP_002900607.1 secreted RxLR effector peptide protein, putative [Phytophthora infestans T30-4]